MTDTSSGSRDARHAPPTPRHTGGEVAPPVAGGPLATAAPLRAHLQLRWRRIWGRLRRLGGDSDGNRVEIYHDGDAAFGSLLTAIAAARQRVWLETYILEPDRLGCQVLAALTAAAERGCEVRLLIDGFGSAALGDEHLRALRGAGGAVEVFNPVWTWPHRMPLQTRDHRKVLVVDEVGFVGGMNISEDYGGAHFGNHRFRDTHVKLEGPGVVDLAAIFAASWYEQTGVSLTLPAAPSPLPLGYQVQILGSNAWRKRRSIQRALRKTVLRAGSRCFLTTPYFVPPRPLQRALELAASRGVDVRVLTAGQSDVPITRRAARHLAGKLLRRGVRIYELYGQTLHAKTGVFDGMYTSIGSFNLDSWSDRRNLEVNLTMIDEEAAQNLEAQFWRDVEHARELHYDTWRARTFGSRLIDRMAYWFLR